MRKYKQHQKISRIDQVHIEGVHTEENTILRPKDIWKNRKTTEFLGKIMTLSLSQKNEIEKSYFFIFTASLGDSFA